MVNDYFFPLSSWVNSGTQITSAPGFRAGSTWPNPEMHDSLALGGICQGVSWPLGMKQVQRHKLRHSIASGYGVSTRLCGRKSPGPTLGWPRSPCDMQGNKTFHSWEGEGTQQQLHKDKRHEESCPGNGMGN